MYRFHVSGLYDGLFVMRDEATSSEWLHYTGECIVGLRAGQYLEMFTTTAMTWKAFRERYPDGDTIPRARQWWRRWSGRFFGSRNRGLVLTSLFRKTMAATDSRLPEGELGLGVFIGRKSLVSSTKIAGAKFYPLKAMRTAGLARDTIGGEPVVAFFDDSADSPIALLECVDGERVDAERLEDGRIRDRRSGSIFDSVGRCVEGPYAGRRMCLAPSVFTRWYGFSQTYPGADIWVPPQTTATAPAPAA